MGYTCTTLLIKTMKDLNLFDEIPYKYIKDTIEDDDDYIEEVEIERMGSDRGVAWCKTKFTFQINQGKVYVWDDKDTYKTFVVEKEYNGSSPFALTMCGVWDHEEDEEEESEDEEENN